MSIFTKSLADIKWDDLSALLAHGSRESVRLEFKSQFPPRNEMLKKLSSMANTCGGYLIIGATEDGNGKLDSFTGVEIQPNYDQTIFQWCFSGIYPPIVPIVTQPIIMPTDSSKCIYVIFVEESLNAPHFLNDRKGCYVRTDEYSQRFDPRHASLPEIEFLQDRRRQALQLRESLFDRAQSRFYRNIYMGTEMAKIENFVRDPSFSLSVTPKFPGSHTYDIGLLWNFVANTRLRARGEAFPSGVIESQPDGFFFSNPRLTYNSYLEIDIHGSIYYAQELKPLAPPGASSRNLLVAQIFAWVIFYLGYARNFYRKIGYDGTLFIRIRLNDISGIQFVLPFPSQQQASARLDNTIEIESECLSITFSEDLTSQVISLYRKFCLSCGHQGAFNADDSVIHNVWLKPCLEELMWSSLD